MHHCKTLLMLLAILTLSACVASTKLVDHWQAETFKRGDLDNVLIVMVTYNETHRFLFENEMEKAMQRVGIKGTISRNALGDTFPQREDVVAYVAKNNISYVMATKLETIQDEKTYIPPQVRTYYTGPYYPSYGSYYGGYNNTITLTKNERVDTRSTVILVTTIFDAKSEEPVWVGRSESFRPDSALYLAQDIARATWKNIAR
ncbi:MAG: hypothetical protein O3A63_20850 [Proteobacteria bacterium]|nr:hypothetical protein [Pseudomonadota bacterium]